MTPEQERQFNEMIRKTNEVYEFMQQKKRQQISVPVDDASRKNMGLGFIARGTETTPVGSLLVQTQEGIVKVLYAS